MQGLYLHVPYCSQRCVYCDFYFVTSSADRSPFVRALCDEIAHYGRRYGHEGVETVYFGGGTPSLLSLEQITEIMEALRKHFDLSKTIEITFELNPEDLNAAYLKGLCSLGVTRPSVGLQSLHERDLQFMNRVHGSLEAEAAIPALQNAGFHSFTVDLIYGIPGQPLSDWNANLQHVIDLKAPHVSAYALTIEEKTPLHRHVRRGLVTPQSDEMYAASYEAAMARLQQAGYQHYEISSFALPGQKARHNERYWNHVNYIGLGPSAQSFRWQSGTTVPAKRWGNVRSLSRYISSLQHEELPVDFAENLSMKELATEYIMLRLRTDSGINLREVYEKYRFDLEQQKRKAIADLEARGLLTAGQVIRLTNRGLLLCDAVTALLIP